MISKSQISRLTIQIKDPEELMRVLDELTKKQEQERQEEEKRKSEEN